MALLNPSPAVDGAWQNQRPKRGHDRYRQLGAHQGSTVSCCHCFNPSYVLFVIWGKKQTFVQLKLKLSLLYYVIFLILKLNQIPEINTCNSCLGCFLLQKGSKYSSVRKWQHSAPEWCGTLHSGDGRAGSYECRLRTHLHYLFFTFKVFIHSTLFLLGPLVFGQWHNFCGFASVHHYNGFEMNQWSCGSCVLDVDFHL